MSRAFHQVFLGCLVLAASLRAQTPDDHNEGARIEMDAVNEIYRFKWWGRAGRTYFIQHSENLVLWNWAPVVESGNDAIKEYDFATTGSRFFARLKYSDVVTSDPQGADFDGDGLGNLWEVQNGLNPLRVDSDGDDMPDRWEVANGLNPLGHDALGDLDNDLIPNREDARPNNGSVGRLTVTISTPSNGGSIP